MRAMLAEDYLELFSKHSWLLPYGVVQHFATETDRTAPIIHFTNGSYWHNASERRKGLLQLLSQWGACGRKSVQLLGTRSQMAVLS